MRLFSAQIRYKGSVGYQPGGTEADFWGPNFGFYDFPTFEAAAQKVLPSFLPFGNLGMNDTAIGLAWKLPWSSGGVLLQSLFTADGYTGQDRAVAGAMAQIPAGAVAQGSEGTAMGQLIIPGCFQVAIHAQSGGQAVDNVIGVQNASGSAAAAAAAVQTAWKIASGPLAAENLQYQLVDFTAVDIGSSNGSIVVVSDTATGGTTGALATNAACALVKWNGSTRSRSTRGRLYFGPLTESAINNDGRTLTSTYLTSINTAFTNFRSSLASSGYPLVVLSRKTAAAYAVTSHAVETVIATQRRRIRT